MKIGYLAQIDASMENGVVKKFLRQTKYWLAQDWQVKASIISPKKEICKALQLTGLDVKIFTKKNDVQLFFGARKFLSELEKEGLDVVYMRFSKYLPGMLRLAKKQKTIVEINTRLLQEHKSKSRFPVYLYTFLTNGLFFNKASAFIFLTNEIADDYRRFRKPSIVIGDGIELVDYRILPPTDNLRPHLAFMSTNTESWQGIDKVIRLAKAFPDWVFHLIGSLEKYPYRQQAGTQENIILHGYLSRPDYEPILEKCDIGIGSLGLHRIGMRASTPLKVREYLAYGLPVIIAHEDADLDPNDEFVLLLENEEENIEKNLDRIADFIKRWQGRRIRKDQILKLDSEKKETERFAFMKNIAQDKQ